MNHTNFQPHRLHSAINTTWLSTHRFHNNDSPCLKAAACCACLALALGQAAPLAAQQDQPAFAGAKVSGSLELDAQQVEGQDVDGSELPVRDTGLLEAEITLELEQKLGDSAEFVARLNFRAGSYSEDNLNTSDEEFSYRVDRLYLQQELSGKKYRWRIGRQSIDDSMNTIVDEDLDGIRLSIDQGQLEFDLSITQEDLVEAGSIDRSDEIANIYATLEYKPAGKTVWMPYILYRDQSEFGADVAAQTAWYGVQGVVQPGQNWRYWLHAAAQDGQEDTQDSTRDLGGFMADFGVTWKIDHDYKPTLTLGVAHGSGGSNNTDNREDRFRQSGLHSNDFRLNDKNRFRYLGEVVDPEITNIQILTLGVGAEFGKRWAADLAFHAYSQVELEAGNRIRGSDLEFESNGLSDDLGNAADFVLSFEPSKNIDIQATAGVFNPGSAFDANQDMAWIGQLELDYSF